MLTSHLHQAHKIWKKHLQPGDSAIDATCGNGHDALFLMRCHLSHLYCIDIQQAALNQTEERLLSFKKFSLHLACHSTFPMVANPIQLIVYNLGYLPGGNKALTTQVKTTLQSIENGYNLLNKNGLISITLYPGHPEGKQEEKSILNWVSQLPHNKFQVCHYRWLKSSKSPTLLTIKKTN